MYQKLIENENIKKIILAKSSYILILFILILFIKIYLSFQFSTPWIFSDEGEYDEIARNIHVSNILEKFKSGIHYPPGYSVFISSAYLFSEDKDIIYHLMLVINSILTTSAIFPSYFILKEKCSENISILGALAISTLPQLTIYPFVVLSENLYIPLFIYSIWFLFKSFETGKIRWHFLTGFSVFYLFFTRTIGIAMVIGLITSVLYFIFENRDGKYGSLNSKKTEYTLIYLILPLLAWKLYNIVYNIDKSGIIKYDSVSYVGTLTEAFSSASNTIHFIALTIHEIELVFVATYFIFAFYIAILLLLFKPKISQLFGYRETYGNEDQKDIALQICIIYFIASFVITLVITVSHMFGAPEIYGYSSKEYMVFGRYLDPYIPPIFLFGIIGIDFITKLNNKTKFKTYQLILLITAFAAILVYFTFPTENYKMTNMFSICYLQFLTQIIPFGFIIVGISVVTVALFKLIINDKKYINMLLIFSICCSFFVSICPYQHEIETSINTENVNQIGRYLQSKSDEHTVILMDRDDFNSFWGNPMWYLTQFWTNGKMIRCSTVNDSSGTQSACAENVDYILSTKILPYPIESRSKNGYKLYSRNYSSDNKDFPYTIVIGENDNEFTDNFYENEVKGETTFRWTKNCSYVILDYPKKQGDLAISIKTSGHRPSDNNAQVVYYINNHKVAETTKQSGDDIFSFEVPNEYLNDIYQLMEIKTNIWKPSDYESLDTRELGVQVEWIKVERSTT